MRLKLMHSFLILMTVTNFLVGQNKQPSSDPLQAHLLPPELIMQHQKTIGLTEEQRDQIIEEIGQAQSEFTTLNWDLRVLMDQFVDQLSAVKIDENAALQHLEEILQAENQIKKAQMTLMIRLKNFLTKEQQDALKTLKS